MRAVRGVQCRSSLQFPVPSGRFSGRLGQQRLVWVPVAFPVCSAGCAGCAALLGQAPGCAGGRAGPGTAVLCPCPCRAGDSRALDPRPERGPRGRCDAGAAESTAQDTQGCHFLKVSWLSNSSPALLHSRVVTTESGSRKSSRLQRNCCFFASPHFPSLPPKLAWLPVQLGTTGAQQVAILLKKLWVFFKGSCSIIVWFCLFLSGIMSLFLCMFQLEQSCGEVTDQPCGLPSLGCSSW